MIENSITEALSIVVQCSAVGVPPLASVWRAWHAASQWMMNSLSSISWISLTEFSSMTLVMGIS